MFELTSLNLSTALEQTEYFLAASIDAMRVNRAAGVNIDADIDAVLEYGSVAVTIAAAVRFEVTV